MRLAIISLLIFVAGCSKVPTPPILVGHVTPSTHVRPNPNALVQDSKRVFVAPELGWTRPPAIILLQAP